MPGVQFYFPDVFYDNSCCITAHWLVDNTQSREQFDETGLKIKVDHALSPLSVDVTDVSPSTVSS